MYYQKIKKKTEKRFTKITLDLKNIVAKTDVKYGLMHIFSKHTTCGIKILEDEILSLVDLTNHLEKVAPGNGAYEHDRIELREVPPDERINAVSHVRMLYVNSSVSIPIHDYALALGKWQNVFLVEMDYKPPFREREIIISILDGGLNGTS